MTPIAVVDYGMGNIWSVISALRYLGHESIVTSDPAQIRDSNTIILPGVGSFRRAMETLRARGLDEAIVESVQKKGAKILGICLGMQLLGARGTEDGDTAGLGLVPGTVDKFSPAELAGQKSPHIGFNTVTFSENRGLFQDLPERADFYFVHSYRMLPGKVTGRTAVSSYDVDFLAAFESENICGTQFHPEKSQTNGLTLLKNFLR